MAHRLTVFCPSEMDKLPAKIKVEAWDANGILLEHYTYTAGAVEPLPKHSHADYQFGLSFDCQGQYHYRGATHPIPTGSLSVIHSGEVHSPSDRTSLPEPAQFWMMHIDPEWFRMMTQDMTERATGLPFFSSVYLTDPVLNDLFLKLHSTSHQHGSQLDRDTALWRFLAYLLTHHASNYPRINAFKDAHRSVICARDYLHAHYANDVSLNELAAIAGLSRFHFCRVFRRATGLSPSAYQTQLRIAAAKRQLANGTPISTVASTLGFYDQSHFGWHFKRQVGVTPGAYVSKRAIIS